MFSQAAGSYEKAFDLEITAGESQTVYYTTDGTDPATSDTRKVYENALRIDDRSDDENVLSAYDPMKIQLDYRDSIELPDKSAVDKGTVIRACAEGTSGKCGKTVTATYFVDVSSADHNDLPIVSITTDPDGLFNEKTGIYCLGDVYKEYDEENPDHPWNGSIPANYNQRGREWEKECYVEYFDSEGNSLISQDCGIRIQGGWSRADYQKSFRLYARNDYGKSSFDTVFWDSFTDVNGEAITSCKTFVLSNGGNDANYSKFKDMMIQNMVSGRGVETQQGTACVLFIDGEYWGLYTLQSDYSDRYFADRYNVAKSNVVMYKNDELSDFFRVTFTIPLCTDKRNGACSSLCTLKAVPKTSILACSVSIQKGCPCFFATSKKAFPCKLTSRLSAIKCFGYNKEVSFAKSTTEPSSRVVAKVEMP